MMPLWAVLATSWFVVQTAAPGDQAGISPETLSFEEQLLLSNHTYIADNVRAHLRKLDDYDKSIRGHPRLPLHKWLDFGEQNEIPITQEIEMILAFQKSHNGLMDRWVKLSKAALGNIFYEPFKMESATVKKIKNKEFPTPWRFVAIHWYPKGLIVGLVDHPIPYDGLGLRENLWLEKQPDLQRYAFFSFYRKNGRAAEVNQTLLGFLKRHTGYHPSDSLWKQAIRSSESVHFDRWQRPDYYSYRVVSQPPSFTRASLPNHIVSEVCYLPKMASGGLSSFYEQKCAIFSDLIAEMLGCIGKSMNIDPYWELYRFFACTFPYISAFKLSKSDDGSWCFIEGYEGDRPSIREFSDRSVIGAAYFLYKTAGPSPQIAEQVFGPIFLLQMRFDPKVRISLKEADIRVGFRGHLDFYHELLASRRIEE